MFGSLMSFGSRVVAKVQSKGRMLALALACVTAVVVFGGAPAFATAEPELPAIPALEAMFDYETLATALIGAGGAALIASFGIGATFRIGKKAFAWALGKIR